MRDTIQLQAPDTRASSYDIIAHRMDAYRNAYVRAREKCLAGDTNAVHDMRVALRRLIAAVELLQSLTPNALADSLPKKIYKRLLLFSELRDVQVLRKYFTKLTPGHPGIRRLTDTLRKRETALAKNLPRISRKPSANFITDAMITGLTALMEKIVETETETFIRKRMEALLDAEYSNIRRLAKKVAPHKQKTIHKTRVALKRVRYLQELCIGIVPDVTDEGVNELKTLQSCMGTAHDCDVMLDTLYSYKEEYSMKKADFAYIRQKLLNRRSDAIGETMQHIQILNAYGIRTTP